MVLPNLSAFSIPKFDCFGGEWLSFILKVENSSQKKIWTPKLKAFWRWQSNCQMSCLLKVYNHSWMSGKRWLLTGASRKVGGLSRKGKRLSSKGWILTGTKFLIWTNTLWSHASSVRSCAFNPTTQLWNAGSAWILQPSQRNAVGCLRNSWTPFESSNPTWGISVVFHSFEWIRGCCNLLVRLTESKKAWALLSIMNIMMFMIPTTNLYQNFPGRCEIYFAPKNWHCSLVWWHLFYTRTNHTISVIKVLSIRQYARTFCFSELFKKHFYMFDPILKRINLYFLDLPFHLRKSCISWIIMFKYWLLLIHTCTCILYNGGEQMIEGLRNSVPWI